MEGSKAFFCSSNFSMGTRPQKGSPGLHEIKISLNCYTLLTMSRSATVMKHFITSQRSCRFFLYSWHADFFFLGGGGQTVGYRDLGDHGLYPRRPIHCCGYVYHIRTHAQNLHILTIFSNVTPFEKNQQGRLQPHIMY